MTNTPPAQGVILTDDLLLDTLPGGAVSRLSVALVEDGLGRPIRVPVLVAKGARPGPVVGLTAAVHGNELNGIALLHRLFDSLDVNALAGTVVGVLVVNVPGLHLQQRAFSTGEDLNHVFPGRPDGTAAQVYVHHFLSRIVRSFDVLLDLHTASFGRVNSLYVRADMTEPRAARMAYELRPEIVVHSPPADSSLRGAVAALGVPAVTLEIGNPQRFHRDYVGRSLAGVRAVLRDLGMIRRRLLKPAPEPVICASSFWIYTDAGGLLEVAPPVTAAVGAGETIGVLRNVYGDVIRTFVAPQDGVVVGRSVNPVGLSGARILHLGIPAPAGHPFLTRSDI